MDHPRGGNRQRLRAGRAFHTELQHGLTSRQPFGGERSSTPPARPGARSLAALVHLSRNPRATSTSRRRPMWCTHRELANTRTRDRHRGWFGDGGNLPLASR
jgi:hypothetical protein